MPEESPPSSASPEDVVEFWRNAGPKKWFAKNASFDQEFNRRFAQLHEAAICGKLQIWGKDETGALALVILLDQFPRNAFRNTPRMYASDALALSHASAAIAAGLDRRVPIPLRLFFYLPFAHSENLDDQNRSVELTQPLGKQFLRHAIEHREIIKQFGRFPHRNPIIGRAMTVEEKHFLESGGFSG